MAGSFVGTSGQAQFTPNAGGAATVDVDGCTVILRGLKPLPDGVSYTVAIGAYDPSGEAPAHDDAHGGSQA